MLKKNWVALWFIHVVDVMKQSPEETFIKCMIE